MTYIMFINTHQILGWSALFFAAKDGRLEIVKQLTETGANTMLRDKVIPINCFNIIMKYTINCFNIIIKYYKQAPLGSYIYHLF